MDDVQSWWEIPCIAHFCSLFRLYFNLVDFDIEELEEALVTESAEDVGSSWLQELIVRLLRGCFNSQQDEITTSNYQMYLRRLFRKKCEEGSTSINPFETDATFHSLALRTKVEILYHICDFRLDNEDVPESLKSLQSDSLRVEPLGRDSGGSTYWYFYGTRLYREDYTKEIVNKKGKSKEERVVSKWQVVCYTEEDWQVLTRKFKNCKSIHEKNLHRTLSTDFLPELPRLFAEKERLQRQRMLDKQFRRTGTGRLGNLNLQHHLVEDHLIMPNTTTPTTTNTTTSKKNHHHHHHENHQGASNHTTNNHEEEDDEDSHQVKLNEEEEEEDETMEEEELRRQREEQERADRLLAEEIEREERKARLHLRERRGGVAVAPPSLSSASSSFSSSSPEKRTKTKNNKKATSPSPSPSPSSRKSSKSPVKSKIKKEKKKSDSKKHSKTSSLKPQGGKVKGAKSRKKNEEDEDDEDNEEELLNCDEEEDEEEETTNWGKKRRRRSRSPRSRINSESRSRSRSASPSRSRSPPKGMKKKKITKKKEKEEEEEPSTDNITKGKGKSKDKEKKKKQKEKLKKEKVKDKPVFDINHSPMASSVMMNPLPGLSKTKIKSSVLFSQTEEDIRIGMHKVIESIKNHADAWPFMNPVDEDYAPNYYRVITSPMDLQTVEDKLDNHEYSSLDEFILDFQRIVDNCVKYNGPSSEYTEMVQTLQEAFNKAVQRYIVPDESDEEISIEYNNLGLENKKKRPRTSAPPSGSKKSSKEKEHKKENDPKAKPRSSSTKEKSSKAKSSTSPTNKKDENKKSKMKHKLMRHHSKDSAAMENLHTTAAETLKDIDKWLEDTPKRMEYATSGAAAFDSLRSRILGDDNNDRERERENEKKKEVIEKPPGGKVKPKPTPSTPNNNNQKKKRSPSSPVKGNSKKRDYVETDEDDEDVGDDEEERFVPPKKKMKKALEMKEKDKGKKGKGSKGGKGGKVSKDKDGDGEIIKPKKGGSNLNKEKKDKHKEKDKGKDGHGKDKHHHPHTHSHKGHNKDRDFPPINHTSKVKNNNAKDNKDKDSEYTYASSSPSDAGTPEKEKGHHPPSLSHSKSFEEKKHKPPVKRTNSLLSGLKGSSGGGSSGGATKKLQQQNKGGNKLLDSISKVKTPFESGSGSSKSGDTEESEKKKKCLLLNDGDREGGPKLSLGTVLSTDAIKLVEFTKKSSEDNEDEEENGGEKSKPLDSTEGKEDNKDDKDKEDEEEKETDRKLEPSKGFKPEKCMPNLSAWIKAFGGPPKPASQKKPDVPDPKSKFKVMGRGLGEHNSQDGGGKGRDREGSFSSSNRHEGSGMGIGIPPRGGRTTSSEHHPHWNSSTKQPVNLVSEDRLESSHNSKKNRHRKMSTSSLSSQSETGSPHPFNNNQEGMSSGMGTVVNPPRWVDDHWSHTHTQSPSASSHVSSQSPNPNSPFSPAINSPPQTPPRPVGPVRVGFYQDITASQHSSPEKGNDSHSNSNSNVASPSTPPTPTNNNNSTNGNNGRRDGGGGNGKSGGGGGGYYPPPTYAPRYAGSTPSPQVGPGSNSNPSPGGINVESPPANPHSPHSPSVPRHPSASSEYHRGTSSSAASSYPQNQPQPQSVISSAVSSIPSGRQSVPAHRSTPSYPHPPPSITPYPPPSLNHYGHHPESVHGSSSASSTPQPVMAHAHSHSHHVNQIQAHSQQMNHHQQAHYERYGYHHQMNSTQGSATSAYTQNLTAAHSQRPTSQSSPYPPDPYAASSTQRNMYNHPMASDPAALARVYKPTVSGGELTISAASVQSDSHLPATTSTTSSSSSSTSTPRGRGSSRITSSAENDHPPVIPPRSASAAPGLDGKLSHPHPPPDQFPNGFQWPHNLASLSQIVNSIPNPALNMANAYRQYDQAMAETMSKYQRDATGGYTNLSAAVSSASSSGGVGGGGGSSSAKGSTMNPPAAHSQPADKLPSDVNENTTSTTGTSRRQSSKAESKSSRSSSSKSSSSQPVVPSSAFNFSSLSSAELALYSAKEMPDGSLYSASPPSLAHRPDLYPTSTSTFHPSFSSSSRSTAGTPSSISPYQIPPYIGSHPSPYQPQTSQPFAHTQPPRGLVDPYQQFFQGSPHVMGLLPPSAGYPYPHSLGFPNRPGGWI